MQKKFVNFLPIIAGVAYSVILGLAFPASKYALNFFEPLQVNAFRFTVAFLFVGVLCLTGALKLTLSKKTIGIILLASLCTPIGYYAMDIYSLTLIDASLASILQGILPAVVAIFSLLFLKSKVSKAQWIFIFLAILGVLFINIFNSTAESNVWGILLALGAVLANATYSLVNKKAIAHGASVTDITFVMMGVGAVFFNILAIVTSTKPITEYFVSFAEINAILIILFLGIGCNGIGYLLMNYSLSRLTAVQNSIFNNLCILFSVFAGVALLNETFYWYYFIAIPLILIGVWGNIKFGYHADTINDNIGQIYEKK